MEDDARAVESITRSILASRKYRAVSKSLIEEIAHRELPRRRDLREATQATRNKLHQVAGAFIAEHPPYAKWLAGLEEARRESESAFMETCRRIMMHHASTRERVPVLPDFYSTIMAGIGPVRSVLDIACGLNPLTIPWMSLAQEARYFAVDIYGDLTTFLTTFLKIAEVEGEASEHDVIASVPDIEVDLALVLKTIPCLEQVDPDVGRRLLEALNARVVLVSFPAQSLGGRNRGMVENYSSHFADLVNGHDWRIERFLFPTEVVFRIIR
ncbi:MAG TPA: 16S rRNA methyltransferase [Chloroflexia bacterium]|nr:16S rRNA methyltransferase [Chloroflexia bacterium]